VISGYLVAASYLRPNDLRQYARNRALRIFPRLIVVVLLAIFGLGPIVTTLPPRSTSRPHDLAVPRQRGDGDQSQPAGRVPGQPLPEGGERLPLDAALRDDDVRGDRRARRARAARPAARGGGGRGGRPRRRHRRALRLAPPPRLLGLADPNQFFKLGYFFFAGSLLYLLGDGLRYRWPVAAAL